jgi:hypothetical protein
MFALPRPDYAKFKAFRAALEAADASVQIEALGWFVREFHGRYNWLLSAPGPCHQARIGAADAKLASLQTTGLCALRLDPAIKARLRRLTARRAGDLQIRLDGAAKPTFKDGQIVLDPVEDRDLYAAVVEALTAGDLLDVASAYAGETVRLGSLALQVNTQRSTAFTYGSLDSDGLPQHRTAYLHIDSGGWDDRCRCDRKVPFFTPNRGR